MKNKSQLASLPLISVVIATYNASNVVSRCIDSVLRQTYAKLEILIVDDGSTDDTRKVCEAYQDRDERVKLIYQDNRGAASARNSAIRNARGEYIVIVDSDDWVTDNYVELLLDEAISNKADIAVCNFYFASEDGRKEERNDSLRVSRALLTSKRAIFDHLSEEPLLYEAFWNKIYKTSLFRDNNIVLPEGDIYEDARSLYKLYFYANVIAYFGTPLYYYLQRDGSVMRDRFKRRNLELLSIVPAETEEWLHSVSGDEYNESLFSFRLSGYLAAINYMCDHGEMDEDIWSENSHQIKKSFLRLVLSSRVGIKRKIAYVACICGPAAYAMVRRAYRQRGG